MDRISFEYSTKNIPTASKQSYLKCLIDKTEKLIKNMRWRAFFYLNPPKKQSNKETYDFKSTRTPPAIDEMKVFEAKMTRLIQNIEFSKHTNDFQQKIKQDIQTATNRPNCKSRQNYKLLPNEVYRLPVTHRKECTENLQESIKQPNHEYQ